MSNHSKTSNSGSVKAGQEQAHEAADAVKEGAGQAVDFVKTAAAQIQERAGKQIEEWGETASEFAEDRLRKFRNLETALEQHIRQKPITTMLVVAGVGILLGAIWRRR